MSMQRVQKLFDLGGRSVLVTGGSRGLGLQMARAMGEAGASVMLVARKADELEQAALALRADGIDAHWTLADCAQEEQIGGLVQTALQTLGAVDILINNAGVGWRAPAQDHPVAAWDKVMNLNVRGYFLLSQLVARRSMIPRAQGRIINVASIAGLNGNPPYRQTLAYNTSKSAVIGFTRTLAAEWGRHGITVNAICPGIFMTRMASGLASTLTAEWIAERVPMGRIGDDEDLKGAALLFASRAGQHITGQCLAVDGGMSSVLGV
ncbi:SDR family oxidoreductase [Hydrogenophaga sp.]|uniref:SDR family oxidoreductase n=1 Tax=Hydrogenophaga sp. TaxID=1904254 RepID=UPI00271BBCBF|nr:SDR family oxidoreductase [Hydrogenophaga sp.]MDO9439052.1 SDR family oxidoreductase [Hydrogenophaga sp.]